MAEENVGGRPPIIDTPEEFNRLVNEYVANCKANGEPVTFTGMALHMGFASRQSFYDYGKRDGFSYSALRARSFVELEYEKVIARNGDKSCGGAQFALRNHGWADKHELEVSGAGGGPLQIAVTHEVIDPSEG